METSLNRSNFRFSAPVLLEAIYMANPNFTGDLSEVGSTPFKIEVHVSPKNKNDDGTMTAEVSESVMTSEKIDQSASVPFYLRVTMSAGFSWHEADFSDQQADSLLSVNAPAFLLSYIRTVVANLTEQAAIATQHIPFLDFAHANNSQQSSSDEENGK